MVDLLFLAESETKFQDLVTIVPWTFIFQIVNLFLTMLLIKHFLFKPIREVLQKRKEKADAVIQDAEQAKLAALSMKSEYEQNMITANEKADHIIADAKRTAALKSEAIIKEASEQAVAMKAKAEQDIAQERRKAVNEIKDEIGSMAMEIAGKVIEREVSEKDHAKLIDEFIENVGGNA